MLAAALEPMACQPESAACAVPAAGGARAGQRSTQAVNIACSGPSARSAAASVSSRATIDGGSAARPTSPLQNVTGTSGNPCPARVRASARAVGRSRPVADRARRVPALT